jgi:hypothetical protein
VKVERFEEDTPGVSMTYWDEMGDKNGLRMEFMIGHLLLDKEGV